MKNIKKFENWHVNDNPAEQGMAAAKNDDYLMRNAIDEVSINLKALDDNLLDELLSLLKRNNEIIPDEDNEEAVNIIETFKESEK